MNIGIKYIFLVGEAKVIYSTLTSLNIPTYRCTKWVDLQDRIGLWVHPNCQR